MNDVVKMGKCGCVSPAIWLVQGDTRSHILTIRVPRMESGVDLKDLAWKINITNEAGVDDVDVPVMGSVVIDERTIAFDWLIHGVATDVPGKTTFSVVGVDETEDGKPIIWRSSPAMIYIREKHDATPSEEVETELGELEKMIVYVNGELTNVIAAGEMARSAATHPPIIGDNGNWFLWDLENEIYVDSGMNTRGSDGYSPIKNKDYFDGKDGYTPQKGIDYTDGEPGFSPAAKVTQTSDGAKIEITDQNGTTTAEVKNGKDGDPGYTPQKGVDYFDGKDGYTPVKGKDYFDGAPGADAFSPIAKVYQTANGARVEVTDKNGTTSAEIENGNDGAPGPKGDPGDDNVLVVKLGCDENYNFVVDKTQAEVKQAVADGKAVIMLDVDVGTTLLYMGESTMDGEQCPFFVSPLSEIGMTSLLTNIVYLKKSGEVVYMSGSPINPLTIKTADGTETFDGSAPKTIDLTNLGSGGSGGGKYNQPDWGYEQTQNLPETTIEIADMQGMIVPKFDPWPMEGVTYDVFWNGTKYSCMSQYRVGDSNPVLYLGNVGGVFGGVDTGEPFVIMIVPETQYDEYGMSGALFALDGSTAVKLSISGEAVYRIPAKYIDEGILLKNTPYIVKLTNDGTHYFLMDDVTLDDIFTQFNRGRTIYLLNASEYLAVEMVDMTFRSAVFARTAFGGTGSDAPSGKARKAELYVEITDNGVRVLQTSESYVTEVVFT